MTTPYERFLDSKNLLAMEWLSRLLALRCVRSATIPLTRRDFAISGPKYKCADGPWRENLYEAILAHKAKTIDAGGKPE